MEILLSHLQINPNIFNTFNVGIYLLGYNYINFVQETPFHAAKYCPHILTVLLNHPQFDKSTIFEDTSIYMNVRNIRFNEITFI